jgi:hypothetical protein
MMLYFLYAITFVYQISKNRFPLEGDIVMQNERIGHLIKIRKQLSKKDLFTAIFRNPVLLLVILSLFYLVLMVIVSVIDIDGVLLAPVQIGVV